MQSIRSRYAPSSFLLLSPCFVCAGRKDDKWKLEDQEKVEDQFVAGDHLRV